MLNPMLDIAKISIFFRSRQNAHIVVLGYTHILL